MDFNNQRLVYRQSSALGDEVLVPAIESAGTGGFPMVLELMSLFTDTSPADIMDTIRLEKWEEFRNGQSDYAIAYHSSANDEHTAAVIVNDNFSGAFNFDQQGSGRQCVVRFSDTGKWNAAKIDEGATISEDIQRRLESLDPDEDAYWDELERLMDEVDQVDPPKNDSI
jgi:hypothetical protein